ncbi:hypothetical protein AB0407_34615 [Streptomyces microflavus]|uniref:hypothetical protein n=1 Tax=Streptomyces microflavus TaxID=1919 RepID=UPI00344FDD51
MTSNPATEVSVVPTSGELASARGLVDWTFLSPPGAAPSFWDALSPVAGLETYTKTLSPGSVPDPAGWLSVRAVDAYRVSTDEPPTAPGGSWASYTETGTARRVHWPARELSGTAGMVQVSAGNPADDARPGLERGARTVVEVSASNESFRRKLFRMSLIAPLMLNGGVSLVHGVAITRGGVTVLLAGGSGSGKSTLGLAAFAHGWRVVAEDLVFVTSDLSVVPMFLSGAWESRVRPGDREVISRITGTELRGHNSSMPTDHRGRDYFFPVRSKDGTLPDRPLPIALVAYVDRAESTQLTSGGRAGQVLGAGPGSTLGAMAKLLRLDFTPVVRATGEVSSGLVTRLPSQRFVASGRPEEDVQAFLSSLDRWAEAIG